MRRQLITTTKVLSVALSIAPLATGCTKPEVRSDQAQTTAAATSASVASVDPPKGTIDREKLQALQDELGALPRDEAMKKIDHFRPLCDDKGYPLVGNLQRKAMDLPPSELCAEVRKQNKI